MGVEFLFFSVKHPVFIRLSLNNRSFRYVGLLISASLVPMFVRIVQKLLYVVLAPEMGVTSQADARTRAGRVGVGGIGAEVYRLAADWRTPGA